MGSCIYGIDVNSIEHAVAARCAQKNIRLAFAESGSSGLAAKRFSNADSEGKLAPFPPIPAAPGADGFGKTGNQ